MAIRVKWQNPEEWVFSEIAKRKNKITLTLERVNLCFVKLKVI